jgi:hypothetical protein
MLVVVAGLAMPCIPTRFSITCFGSYAKVWKVDADECLRPSQGAASVTKSFAIRAEPLTSHYVAVGVTMLGLVQWFYI